MYTRDATAAPGGNGGAANENPDPDQPGPGPTRTWTRTNPDPDLDQPGPGPTRTRTRTMQPADPDQPGPGPRPTWTRTRTNPDYGHCDYGPPYKNGGGRRAVPNQRVCDFADPPTEEEGGGIPKKVAQCKRVKFGGRRASPTRQYNSRGVQWGANPAMKIKQCAPL